MYKCPYCGKSEYNKNSKKQGSFESWNTVRKHSSKCKNNSGEYYIDLNEGPLHYTVFNDYYRFLRAKYPNLFTKLSVIRKSFLSRGIEVTIKHQDFSKDEIVEYFHKWVLENNTTPTVKDWSNNLEYPDSTYVSTLFGSWNKAVESAGLKQNINSFGIPTKAKDGHLYRSKAEAYFVDNYLYDKYKYEIEPKYPKPYNKYYDWYLLEYDIYIELDGKCRENIIEEKIKINKKLHRKLLVLDTSKIYTNYFDLHSNLLSVASKL